MRIEVNVDGPNDGPTNMARDLELLGRAEQGTISVRVYTWDGPWISLGKFQDANTDLLASAVPYVVRPTGGKAVLHGHDVTVGLAVPLGLIDCSQRDVRKAYRIACRPLVDALKASGLAAVLAEDSPHVRRGQRSADCFASNSANDIVHEDSGQKLCGCALLLSSTVLLLQASIPKGTPLVDPSTVLEYASDYIGPSWDSTSFGFALESALRYNLAHVSQST